MDKLITSTAAANPVPLASVTTNYRKLTLIACKGLSGPTANPNTGLIRIGRTGTAGQQPIEMNPGDERNFDAASGAMNDLMGLFLTVANDGDGVVATYF